MPNNHGHPRSTEVLRLWPEDTDLCLNSGRLKLTDQTSIVRKTITKSFELLHASIILEHAFPDVLLASKFIQDALSTASLHVPDADVVHIRILQDHNYFEMMSTLVSHGCASSKPNNTNQFSPVHGSASFAQRSRNAVWQPSRTCLVSMTHQQ
jgi:hypothetical protein